MEPFTIGYKWYRFKIYFEEDKIEILSNNYKLLKKVDCKFDSKLEKIIEDRSFKMISFFEKLLKDIKE